jgi:hypothetical protein
MSLLADQRAGATVVVRAIDGNDRQIDMARTVRAPDRQQIIEGVTKEPLDGQMLRLELMRVQAR